jgi:hypothetical protein
MASAEVPDIRPRTRSGADFIFGRQRDFTTEFTEGTEKKELGSRKDNLAERGHLSGSIALIGSVGRSEPRPYKDTAKNGGAIGSRLTRFAS